MSEKKNVQPSSIDGSLIKRILSIVLFTAIGYVAFLGIILLTAIQLLFCVFSGNKNKSLLGVSKDLCAYLGSVTEYITMQSDVKPFPG